MTVFVRPLGFKSFPRSFVQKSTTTRWQDSLPANNSDCYNSSSSSSSSGGGGGRGRNIGRPFSSSCSRWTTPPHAVSDEEIAALAGRDQYPLSLADLVRHGRPPLSENALLSSANFTLSLLPIRLARRVQAIRNLPFIVVSNPNISKIHQNYLHSLSTLLPWLSSGSSSTSSSASSSASSSSFSSSSAYSRSPAFLASPIRSLADETRFTETLADLVVTHRDTIPVLARGFLECRRYISAADATRFLDGHLRARIGTRLVAEQHIALHYSTPRSPSAPIPFSSSSAQSPESLGSPESPAPSALNSASASVLATASTPPALASSPTASASTQQPSHHDQQHHHPYPSPDADFGSYVGVIDTALRPSRVIESCAGFVADIAELRYGVRPLLEIDGEPGTSFAFVPMHLEYIVTELLKNAFRATIENRQNRTPVVVTIAPEPPIASSSSSSSPSTTSPSHNPNPTATTTTTDFNDAMIPLDDKAPGVTIRIRDRGGGIAPEVFPNIWSYSFTTVPDDDEDNVFFSAVNGNSGGGNDGGGNDGLNAISNASTGRSSIAGLGYGLPLSRAYAEYFGGGIAVQSLYGWGTDVYLRLKGVGRLERG